MFSSALKSFTSNIANAYTISPQPASTAGPWKIFDAKRKATGKAASVFVFDRKSLEVTNNGLGSRSSGSSLKRAHEEVLERLKREASSLAKLRHPSILELVEPVEETRNGGLMFATEPVTASLASLLLEKDVQERSGSIAGRGSRYVVEDSDGTRRRRELEIDELEIQKGLLQIGKGLDFMHESAGLVHANLTPEAILINAKGDWKISGLAFCGPHDKTTAATSLTPILLSEVLNHDPRLPGSVQLNLDYTSPDFVLDNNLNPSADMFSLGLLIIALYNSPHSSPLTTGGSLSSYKRTFASASTIPTRNNNFLVPNSHPLPAKLVSDLLPRLITRRPAQRISAREFQEASYFDNILVSTIRFLDGLPTKTPSEKAQFMRGLPRIMSQFPKSVLEKKVLLALLEEMKDRDLLAPILMSVFAMVKVLPSGKRAFTERIVPKLREVFITHKSTERDTSTEAGLMILLENMGAVTENCSGKDFHDNILPIIILALESPTHGIVDAALGTLPSILSALDYSTIKNELFPVIATVFAKTSSLMIKIRGLGAFYTLCGGTPGTNNSDDGLNGLGTVEKKPSSTSSSVILDKFTVQEKVVPLLKGIKTKEPGVMMAALRVFQQVGEVVDTDFLALDVLPTLWSMSLGPLLNLEQFEAFMTLIKRLSGRIEKEHIKRLQEIGNSSSNINSRSKNSGSTSTGLNGMTNGEEVDFETLVSGRKPANSNGTDLMADWGVAQPARSSNQASPQTSQTPGFSWQSSGGSQSAASLRPQNMASRAITPDQSLSSFTPLAPASTQYSQPLQPNRPSMTPSASSGTTLPFRTAVQTPNYSSTGSTGGAVDWSAAANSTAAWSSQQATQNNTSRPLAFGATQSPTAAASRSNFAILPPPANSQTIGSFNMAKQPARSPQPAIQRPPAQPAQGTQQRNGLDQYESLL